MSEFAFDEEDREEQIREQRRRLFLLEIENIAPQVLASLYDEVYLHHRSVLPLPTGKIRQSFQNLMIESWDKHDNGRLLAKLQQAQQQNDEALVKVIADDRRFRAGWLWDSSHEDFIWWYGLNSLDKSLSELMALKRAIKRWAAKWNLSSDWIYNQTIHTLHEWADYFTDIGEWSGVIYGGGRMGINSEEEREFLPSEKIPRWYPFENRQEQYLSKLRRQLTQHLSKAPFGSLLLESDLKSHTKSLIQLFLNCNLPNNVHIYANQ